MAKEWQKNIVIKLLDETYVNLKSWTLCGFSQEIWGKQLHLFPIRIQGSNQWGPHHQNMYCFLVVLVLLVVLCDLICHEALIVISLRQGASWWYTSLWFSSLHLYVFLIAFYVSKESLLYILCHACNLEAEKKVILILCSYYILWITMTSNNDLYAMLTLQVQVPYVRDPNKATKVWMSHCLLTKA